MTETTRRLSAEADAGSKGEPRRLIVLRHGQTGSNLKGIWQGQLDHELTDLGREQARAAAAAIASLRPTRVVSSDLVRARDTAEEVAAASGGARSTRAAGRASQPRRCTRSTRRTPTS